METRGYGAEARLFQRPRARTSQLICTSSRIGPDVLSAPQSVLAGYAGPRVNLCKREARHTWLWGNYNVTEQVYSLGFKGLFPIHQLSAPALALYSTLNLTYLGYYGWRYLKKGTFSLDTYFLTFTLYLPIIFLFPFTFSRANGFMATGGFHEIYTPYLERAFYICALGMSTLVLGGVFARTSRLRLPGYDLVTKSLRTFLVTKVGLFATAGVVLVLLTLMVALGFEVGNARGTAMAHPALRPLYNLFHILVPFVALNALVYAYGRSARSFYAFGLFLAGVGLFGGTRGASVGVLISFIAIIMVSKKYRGILLPVLAFVALVVLAVYIGGFRNGVYGLSEVRRVPLLVLYGNNLSDLRDFAWVLSGWNGHFVWGKTQLAGFLSFIPSSLVEFRSTWSWGFFSTTTAGLSNVAEHPGLRTTIFGESYFNYGLVGVGVSGFLTGFALFKLTQYVNIATSIYTARGAVICTLGAFTYLNLFLTFLTTAGFFGFYIVLAAIVLGEVVYSAVKNRRQRAVAA